ncbi:hypothetical protein PAAG_05836 [Paracoccidioides lutzii Pb01]|uniref:N-acetyltransferase domain-containing protein n=1 Tax=Paracoccidioides lutzii (strain ATCC MYA-826 / Pb01) TaxID=502779 RepID=C1H4Z5_PARBA|nr:hypothetical protein PAAG_05836 [Paracoccidioides lutzii Pb01]EEH34789.1 hypothetical protein PAAG_05836 [Paracoccidioides lutzii Pb01]
MTQPQSQLQPQPQSQPPLFQVQQWIRSFPGPSKPSASSAESSAETTIPTNETATKEYIISTDPTLLSLSAINTAFAQEYMLWAKPLSEPVVKRDGRPFVIPNSSSILNTNTNTNTTNLTQIGLARIITDNTTFAYLTDVYILPEHQWAGLGSWLLQCVTEWVDSRGDSFRRFMLVTVGEREEGVLSTRNGGRGAGEER